MLAACRGNVIYPSPGTLYGPNYDCGTTACNYGCSFFNVRLAVPATTA